MFCNVVTFILEPRSKFMFYCNYAIIIMFSDIAEWSQLHFKKRGKKHHVSLCCMVQGGFVNPCSRIHNPCALPNIQASVPYGAFCRWPHPTSESNLSNAQFKGNLQFNAIILLLCITLFFWRIWSSGPCKAGPFTEEQKRARENM